MSTAALYQYQEPRRLHGIPGVVYVLSNTALKENILRIGLTRRSGWAKAAELNRDKTNLIPGRYECLFEMKALDGGAAIEAIMNELQQCQLGSREQDFFEVAANRVEEIVQRLINQSNLQLRTAHRKKQLMSEMLNDKSDIELELEKREQLEKEMNQHKQEGIFNKANSWMNKVLN